MKENLIKFNVISQDRRINAHFVRKKVIEDKEQLRVDIELCDIETNYVFRRIPAIDYLRDEYESKQRIATTGLNVCSFLNYLLSKTELNALHECTIEIIIEFLKFSKTDLNGKYPTKSTWQRCRNDVILFLENYYKINQFEPLIKFYYDGDELRNLLYRSYEFSYEIWSESTSTKEQINEQFAKAYKIPLSLAYHHLDIIIGEAQKHDPIIALGIALQAYVGLKIGEVVSTSVGAIKLKRVNKTAFTPFEIYIEKKVHLISKNKKTYEFENTRPRIQPIYKGFLKNFKKLYEQHIIYLDENKIPYEASSPLFVDKNGNPMSQQAYAKRIRKLFYNHFLPKIKDLANNDIEEQAIVDIYEKQYPGTDMFLSWFTEYLFIKAKLQYHEIRDLRGDKTIISTAFSQCQPIMIENTFKK